MMNIYVSNLGDQITDESLNAIFSTYGKVSSARIIKDDISTMPAFFALVEMPEDDEAAKAIARLNGCVINGRNLRVQQAQLSAKFSNK